MDFRSTYDKVAADILAYLLTAEVPKKEVAILAIMKSGNYNRDFVEMCWNILAKFEPKAFERLANP